MICSIANPLAKRCGTLLVSLTILMNARSELVTWTVDPTNSYIRLTIPDQTVYVPDLGNVTVRVRDANNSSQWTDAGGRRAALAGVILTEYVDGSSISFLGGQHNLYALENTSLRPNPAEWDPVNTNYTGTSTAPAALGGRLRATYAIIFTIDVAYLAFRSMSLDITNTTGSAISISNGMFPADTTAFGIASALVDVDGLNTAVGQLVPDVYHAPMDPMVQTNAAGGVIADLGGRNRRLTYTINLPNLTFDFEGTPVTGSAAGVIVATATLSEPPQTIPTLTARTVGNYIVLSWPTNASGYYLQYAPCLTGTNWSPATPSPIIIGGDYVVTNLMAQPAGFYRLRKP